MTILATSVTDQLGNVYDAATPSGAFWVGFGVGVTLFGFRLMLKIAKRVFPGDKG